jgi:hypothetical protein
MTAPRRRRQSRARSGEAKEDAIRSKILGIAERTWKRPGVSPEDVLLRAELADFLTDLGTEAAADEAWMNWTAANERAVHELIVARLRLGEWVANRATAPTC